MRLPWNRFLNYVYAWCVRRIESDKREEWEMQMALPLPNRRPKSIKAAPTTEIAEDGAAFLAAMGR